MKSLITTPDSYVEKGGINFGLFKTPFKKMNYYDANIFKNHRFRLTRVKEWLGFDIECEDWQITFFIQNAKYVSSANCYAINKKTGQLTKHARAKLGGNTRISNNHYDDKCIYAAKNFYLEFHDNLDNNIHRITASIKGNRKAAGLSADITIYEDFNAVQPLVASLPLKGNCTIFTHKAPMPVSGEVSIGDEKVQLNRASDIAIMDEHKSYLPYRTVWRWATFAGYDEQGRLIGANLGDHDTIENQDVWNENCLWIADKLIPLESVHFSYDHNNPMSPWEIRDDHGKVEITFYPSCQKKENFSVGIIGMKYFQNNGHFRGYIKDENDNRISVGDLSGVAEVMDSKW
ncbi:MAG TPA: DUF2804 domain-containing protein [bacterium]|nr:DUF2804 domain-containing protein [bacterium]